MCHIRANVFGIYYVRWLSLQQRKIKPQRTIVGAGGRGEILYDVVWKVLADQVICEERPKR